MDNVITITTSALLLLVGVSGGFVGDTMNCDVRRMFRESMLVRHLLIFALLFYGICVFTDKPYDEAIGLAAVAWALFILFNRQGRTATIISLLLIVALYVISREVDRADTNLDGVDWEQWREIGTYVLLGVIGLGAGINMFTDYTKKRDSAEKFDAFRFFVEDPACAPAE